MKSTFLQWFHATEHMHLEQTQAEIPEEDPVLDELLKEEHEERVWNKLCRRWATKHDDEYRNACSAIIHATEMLME
jgi:hypothetical protein